MLIHCGDLMYSGQPGEWYPRLESLKALEHKTKLIVPGNHDFHMQNYMGVARAELRRVGFKMIGMGRLAAADIVEGGEPRLEPFRLSRYESGVTHAVSNSPYPWN